MPVELNTPCALLVNECQRGLVEPEHALFPGIAEQAQARGIVARIALLATAFRASGQPVVFIHVSHRPDFPGVAVNNPAVAYVRRVGGLCEGSVQVRTLVLAGVSTNAAIPGMLLGGLDRGFQCVVADVFRAGVLFQKTARLVAYHCKFV